MKKITTLIVFSFILFSNFASTNDEKLFFENDIFTVVKKNLEGNITIKSNSQPLNFNNNVTIDFEGAYTSNYVEDDYQISPNGGGGALGFAINTTTTYTISENVTGTPTVTLVSFDLYSAGGSGSHQITIGGSTLTTNTTGTYTIADFSGTPDWVFESGTFTIAGFEALFNDLSIDNIVLTNITPSPPSAPSVAPDLTVSSDTGLFDNDNITNNNTPTFTISGFTATAGDVVKIYAGGTSGTLLGSSVALSGGETSVDITSNVISDGTYSITATITNGSESTESPALSTLVIDTVKPTVNSISKVGCNVCTYPVNNTMREVNATNFGIDLFIEFSETMNYYSANWPTLSYSPDVSVVLGNISNSSGFTSGAGSVGPNSRFRLLHNPTDNDNEYEDIDITISNSADLAGNVMDPTTLNDVFSIDMIGPTSNPNTVLAASKNVVSGASITLDASVSANETAWLIPSGAITNPIFQTYTFNANGSTVTTSAIAGSTITAPTTEGVYQLYILDDVYNFTTTPATATITVDNTAPTLTPSLVANVDEGETALGTISANEDVTWSDSSADVSVSSTGVITLNAGASLANSPYTFTITGTDNSNNATTTSQFSVTVNDITKPVISLLGDNPQVIEVGTAYSELNATASDNKDGDISGTIVINSSTVNTNVVDSYTVTYNVTDAAGNVADQVTRTVNVVDTAKPVITLLGDNPQVIEVGTPYSELNATASDNLDGNISVNIVIDATNVDTNVVDSYTVTYNVTDANNNDAIEVTRTVNVVDTTKPVISLLGDATVSIEVGSTYVDLGVTVSDNYDSNITASLVTDLTDVNINIVDSYTVTYNVTDANGNVADEVTRTVNVVDTTKPVITLLGDATVTIEVGSPYVDSGVTVSDNYDSNITASLVTDLTDVNINIVDSYTVTYNVTDANGNVADEVTRTINVVDTTKPVITLVGDNPQILEYNEVYSELGATATDNYDDNTALTATINIDAAAAIAGASDGNTFGTLGTYNVTYNVTDANGNVADEVTRTVEVVDTTKPVLTLLGDNPQLIEIISGNDAVYVELGATASDEFDLDVDDADIVIDTSALTPNLGNVGCYPVVYSVTDASGNIRTRTRTVFVLEQGKPWAKDDSYTVSQDSQNNELRIINNDSYGTDGANADDKLALIGTYTDNGGKIDLIAETYVLYTPRTGFFGTDSFTYTITDATGDASVATVTITVTQDFAPTAVDDVVTVLENSGLTTINVLANDDFGGNNAHAVTPLTLPSATTAEGGTVVVNAGQVDYTPATDFSGLDSFTYTIKDTDGDTATGTVLITVTVDDSFIPQTPPVAQPDVASVYQNSAGNIIDVLVNDDFGTDGAIDEGLTLPNGTLLGDSDKLGTVSIDTNSTPITSDDVILYTPKSGFVGEDSFKYMITDANGDTSITIVTVTVTELSVPTAVADAVIVVQDSGVTSINVLANDGYGSDGAATSDALILPSATSTQGGSVVLNAGQVDYTPASGFTGQDTFTYVIKDLDGDTSTATVTVTVTSISSASVPTAQDDAVSFTQNSTDNIISILLDNGSGADDFGADNANATHPISLSGSYTDLGGKIDLVGTTVKYSPRTDFVGVDVFSYTITDSNGDSSTAEVTVTVTEITTPTAVDDVASTTEDSGAISIDVLANDSYGFDGAASSDALTLPSATSTQGGTVVVNAGEVDYTPASGFFGTDTFDYTIKDDTGDTSTATVTVTVTEAVVVNGLTVPIAQPDVASVYQNSAGNIIDVLVNDDFGTDGAIDEGLTLPNGTLLGDSDKLGTVSIDTNSTPITSDDVILYTPKSGFVGEDSFKYMITDANGDTSITIVTVTVTELSVPTAVADAVIVVQDSGVTSINVLANDGYGSDGAATSDALILPSATSTQGGSVVLNAGQVDYTPASGFTGQDTFTYVIKDLDGDTSTATVTVTVTSISSASVPTAQDDAVSFTQNSTDNIISILLDNGSGADDFGADNANATHPISLSGSYTDLGGKIDLVGTTVKYSPRTDFVGVDVFSYTITDSNGDSSTAEVTVTVTEITTPTAVDDVASTTEDSGAISIDVLANDSYGFDGAASSDALTLPSATSTQGGTVVVNAGEVDYTPASGFFGTDTFDYTIKDDTGDTSTATVTVTVTEAVVVNDMPTAQDDVVVVLVNTTDNDINILDDNGNGVDVYGTDGANATHPISLFGAYTDKGAKIDLVGNIVKYTPAPSFVGVDKFSYMITDGNGDSSTAEVTVNVNVSRPSDVTDNDNVILKELQVYPNPSEGDVNIIVSSKKTDKVRVVLFDVTGKVVYQNIETLSEGENRINFNINAKSGILMLKVFSEATNYGTRKVVFK